MNKAKKIVACLLVLSPFVTPIGSMREGRIVESVLTAVLTLPFALLGWWLWRSLPPWRDL